MTCARCGKANREGARLCDGCGGPLAPRCPACGAEARPEARFCDACGASLAAKPPAAAAEVRKTVTIVFADLIGSTSLQERLDPESVSRLMDHYYRAVRAPIEAHGGTVVQFLGDGVMCAFGVPRIAEDDAIRLIPCQGRIELLEVEDLHGVEVATVVRSHDEERIFEELSASSAARAAG